MKQAPLLASLQQLRRFTSLHWYEEVTRVIFSFAAQTSELLLASGLVINTANFLTDGKVIGNGSLLTTAWVWAQSIGIDSSLGVTFYYLIDNIKGRDWIKVFCYGFLTAALSFTAEAMNNVDTLSSAAHISITSAILEVGLNVKLLTTLRSVAIVGFVLMSRLKDVSFKALYDTSTPSVPSSVSAQVPERDEQIAKRVQTLLAEQRIAIQEVMKTEIQSALSALIAHFPPVSEPVQEGYSQREQNDSDGQDEPIQEQHAHIARAYDELAQAGKRISGRALAQIAHARRSTCNQWLHLHHPDSAGENSEGELKEHSAQ
jgi:hypothetical protein